MSYALLIEDDPALVKSLTKLMDESGLRLDVATTWDDGLARFLATSPEVVIADYNLPGSEHGLRLLFEIARLRPTTRLVLASAYVTEGDVEKIEALGLIDVALRKIDAVATARRLLAEVENARDRANAGLGTDWAQFATAAQRKRDVSEKEFDELDAFLREHRIKDVRAKK